MAEFGRGCCDVVEAYVTKSGQVELLVRKVMERDGRIDVPS